MTDGEEKRVRAGEVCKMKLPAKWKRCGGGGGSWVERKLHENDAGTHQSGHGRAQARFK